MADIAPRSSEESGRVDEDILGKMGSRNGMSWVRLTENKMCTVKTNNDDCF